MTIKCACGDPECKTKISMNDQPNILTFTDKNGQDTLMYLDLNTIAELVHESKNLFWLLNDEITNRKQEMK